MSKEFEKLRERKGGVYKFEASTTPNQMEGKSGERLGAYYGTSLTPAIVEEIKAWASVLVALKDGLPKPYDNSIIIEKIRRLEDKTGEDLSQLKQCCPPSSDIREAKELKPFIFGILDRIVDISGIQKYVDKYEQGNTNVRR